MNYLPSISQSINYVRPVMPCTVVETTMAGAAVISGLYSAAIGGAIGVGYLSYKGYQYLHSKEGAEGEALDGKIPKKEKITFENGDTYEGSLVQGKFHGKGKYTFMSGGYYEGDFVNGDFHGIGKRLYPDGNWYEGDFVQDQPHGKGKYTFMSGGYYEGDFVNGHCHGIGKQFYSEGSWYEGDFVQDQPHGKGKFTFMGGDSYEGDYVDSRPHGNGKQTSPDGFVFEGKFFNHAIISSNISNLGDRLFYHLLNGLRPYGAARGYNVGIMSDYLQKNGYQDLGSVLCSAHQLLQISPNDMKQKSEKIHGALTGGLSQLFLYGCKGHSMGLHFVPDPSSGSVLCEIFNSGEGLEYHEHHELDFRKHKTMLQIRVPIESITPEKIKTILLCDDLKNVDEAYRHILDLSTPPEIIKSETAPWQTQQKRGECDVRWILSFLKNKMPEKEYKTMLLELRKHCLQAYKEGSSYQDENANQAWLKETKKFPNGDYYEGDFLYGRFHGEGKLTLANGCHYEGNFKGGDFHGKGKFMFIEACYEGDFKDGKIHGKGKYTFMCGGYYEGDFVDGNFHGQGKRVYADGTCYEGGFAQDQFQGEGKFIFGKDNYYEGAFMKGLFHGHGKSVFPNGSSYEGEFTNGAFISNGLIQKISYIFVCFQYRR
jgi:hypothetical protein